MKHFIKETTHFKRTKSFDFGYGNGYVLIPKNHPLHGIHYDNINVNVHGGLTFSSLVTDDMRKYWELDEEDIGCWCIGFDTLHAEDTLDYWTKERVLEETEKLKEQIINYES